VWIEAKGVLDLLGHPIWFGAGQVNFVEDGDHWEVFVVGKKEICNLCD